MVEDADAGVGEGVGDPWRGGESDAIVSLTAHHPLLLLQPHPARTAMPSSYHCCSYRTILHCSYMPPLLGKKLTVIHIFTSSQAFLIEIFFVRSSLPFNLIVDCGCTLSLSSIGMHPAQELSLKISPIGSSPFFQLCCVPTATFPIMLWRNLNFTNNSVWWVGSYGGVSECVGNSGEMRGWLVNMFRNSAEGKFSVVVGGKPDKQGDQHHTRHTSSQFQNCDKNVSPSFYPPSRFLIFVVQKCCNLSIH